MYPIGRFRRSWNNSGYGPQSFQKVGTGNKWFEYFNLNKGVGRNEKICHPVYAVRPEVKRGVISLD